jgi:hypothetical protein
MFNYQFNMFKKMLALIGILLLIGCTETDSGSIKLDFSVGGCDDTTLPGLTWQPDPGIQEVTWLDNTTLQVKAYSIIECLYRSNSITGDYTISGDNILLTYSLPPVQGTAELYQCVCSRQLTYTFYNIPKKDYSFELVLHA